MVTFRVLPDVISFPGAYNVDNLVSLGCIQLDHPAPLLVVDTMKHVYLSILLIVLTASLWLSAAIGFLCLQTAASVMRLGDFTFQTPASLDRPSKGLTVEDAVQ